MLNWIRFALNWLTAMVKRTPPATRVGGGMIVTGVGMLPGTWSLALEVMFPESAVLKSINASFNEAPPLILGVGVILIVFGVFLVYRGILSRETGPRELCAFYIHGMPGQTPTFPIEAIDIAYRQNTREPIILDAADAGGKDLEKKLVFNRQLIQQHVQHKDCRKCYIAGIARVPLLVAHGAMFRNANTKPRLLDHNHQSRTWHLLDQAPTGVKLDADSMEQADTIQANSGGALGLALAFTSPVLEKELPKALQGHTIHLTTSKEYQHNLFRCQEELSDVVHQLATLLIQLSKRCKELHLFLAISAPVAIELGLRYQEGIHCPWIIHNYDGKTQEYSWSVILHGQEMSYKATS